MAALRPLGALLLALGALVAGAAAADELEELRRAIDEHRQRVGRYEREERSLLETIEEMDRAIEALARDAGRARGEAEGARRRLAELAVESEALERRHAATQRALAARAVALYKAGEAGPLRVLFSAESLPELLRRSEVLRLLLARDRALVARFRAERARIEQAERDAREATQQRDEAGARFVQRSSELARERAAREALMRRVRRDRTRTRGALYELEAAAKTLEETVARLGGARIPRQAVQAEVDFESLKGRLPAPVEGTVAEGFGPVVDRDFSTHTFRKGVTFEAREGAPVRAVAEGRVRFAGWFRGYGKLVILDHGGEYFTVSAHLLDAEVEVGERVGAGDRIGTVGETGSLRGPRLYFEIRRGGEAEDPDEWLGP